jgi:hypothetical protein
MRPVGVIMDPPTFDERFGFAQIIEDLPGQQFKPLPQSSCDKLWVVV